MLLVGQGAIPADSDTLGLLHLKFYANCQFGLAPVDPLFPVGVRHVLNEHLQRPFLGPGPLPLARQEDRTNDNPKSDQQLKRQGLGKNALLCAEVRPVGGRGFCG